MNRIYFLFSVAESHPHVLDGLSEDKKRIMKKIVDVCPSCLRLKKCQKGCAKIKGENETI